MDIIIDGFIPAVLIGYALFMGLTHQKSPVWRRLEKRAFKAKRLQILPSVRYQHRDKIFHFHHWMNFSILLAISLFFNVKVLDHTITQGLLVGGIIQGLQDPMSRKFIYPRLSNSKTYHHKF